MFPNYNGKLLTIIWMGVGSALLSTIFSTIIIALALKTNRICNKVTSSS